MSTNASTTTAEVESREQKSRAAVRGAFAGFFVDMFDVYLPVVALAPANAYFRANDVSASTASVIAAMIFVATLLGRPVGAALFGHLGDRIGRRRTAMISVTGFGVVTLLIALLPGYQQFGMVAVVVMILLRFIDGVFLGGEYTAASPLAMEYSPKHKRGLNGAIIMTGFPLAYCAISVLTLVMLQIAPAGGLDSPYVQWGWRIPFVVGALLAFAFVAYYAKSVSESDVWEKTEHSKSPLRDVFRGESRRSFLQVFLMMTGVWLTLFMVSAVLPELLKSAVGLSDGQATTAVLLGSLIAVGGYIAAGVLSQRTGRRPFFIGAGVLTATLGAGVYAVIMGLGKDSFGLVVTLVIIVNVVILSCWGVVTTYVNERFHTGVRASGFGLGYTFAVIIPSFYAFYQTSLSTFMPKEYTPVVLLVIGGALMALGAALGPESRDVDMTPGH